MCTRVPSSASGTHRTTSRACAERRTWHGGRSERTRRGTSSATSVFPSDRRIFRVDCSVDGEPCRLEVGEPLAGERVIAIFELRGGEELVVSTAEEAVALRVPVAGADVLDFA